MAPVLVGTSKRCGRGVRAAGLTVLGDHVTIFRASCLVADHDIDTGVVINVTNPHGVNVEGCGPTWWYGAASEHSADFQFSFTDTSNATIMVAQTESPYWQARGCAAVFRRAAFTAVGCRFRRPRGLSLWMAEVEHRCAGTSLASCHSAPDDPLPAPATPRPHAALRSRFLQLV